MNHSSKLDMLRVTIHEHDIQSLMDQYPKLTRTEISDVVTRHGPMRAAVETELEKVSRLKR
jgi:hypothetical protein